MGGPDYDYREAPDSDYLVFRIRRDDGALLTVTGSGIKPLQGDRLEIRGHGTFGNFVHFINEDSARLRS